MIRKHIASAAVGLALMFTIVGCGSDDPVVGNGPDPAATGSEVDRSSAEATAVAFARIYATGDVPAACEFADDLGKKNIGDKCSRAQQWSTTVTLVGDCERKSANTVSPDPAVEARSFHFESPVGSIDRNSDLIVVVEREPSDDMWWVTQATVPSSDGLMMSCSDSSSAPSPATSPAAETTS